MQPSNSIRIRHLNIANVDDLEFQNISAQVNGWGFAPADHMQELVYKKYILGRWLAWALLESYGVPHEHFRNMTLSSFGKPCIPNHTISFNISHSGDLIICAGADHGKIGIDIEQLRLMDWKQYEDSFSFLDWRQISLSPDPCRKLLELWTKKESLLKADGRGLQIALADVILQEDYGTIKNEEKKWHFRQIRIEEGYTCHVCAEFPIMDIEMG